MLTFELIEKLKPSEWDELKKFVLFRFPRMRKDVVRGLAVLRRNQTKVLSRHDIHAQLYRDRPFNDKAIRYLLTDMNKVLFEYFSFKQLTKQPQHQQALLLQELSERKCPRAFDKTYHQELKRSQQRGHVDADALRHRYELHSLKAKEAGSG